MSKCWHCQKNFQTFMPQCQACGKLQPPQKVSPFMLLSLAPTYNIAEKDLESAYLTKQRLFHPDCHIKATPQEKVYAAQWAAMLNDAYQLLKNPVNRAEALLGKNVLQHFPSHQHQDLLQEMLIWQEKLAQTKTQSCLEEMKNDIKDNVEHQQENLTKLFENKADEDKIVPVLFRLRYMLKAYEDITQKLKETQSQHATTNT